MRCGLIARADNTGLGTHSLEFYENLKEHIAKVIVITNGSFQSFPERFSEKQVYTKLQFTESVIASFLKDIDLVLAIETPYRWEVFREARLRGIKSALIPMFECNEYPLAYYPDLIICSSEMDYESFAGEYVRRERLDLPVDRKKIKYRRREKAVTFVHNVGHGGIGARASVPQILESLKYVPNRNIRILIRSQVQIEKCDDPRVEIRIQNLRDYWNLWDEGDVYLLPYKFEMVSRPAVEALAAGMPVITTDFRPFKDWFPSQWLLGYENEQRVKLSQRWIRFVSIDPKTIAEKINMFAEKDISLYSDTANDLADAISWDSLKPRYVSLLENLCNSSNQGK